jgi:hypothetical protein
MNLSFFFLFPLPTIPPAFHLAGRLSLRRRSAALPPPAPPPNTNPAVVPAPPLAPHAPLAADVRRCRGRRHGQVLAGFREDGEEPAGASDLGRGVEEASRSGRAGGDGGGAEGAFAEGAFRRRAAVVRQRAKLG